MDPPPPGWPHRRYSDSHANFHTPAGAANDHDQDNITSPLSQPHLAWSWWPSEGPGFSTDRFQSQLTIDSNPFVSSPSPASFNTPLSDSILLQQAATSDDVSPNLWPREFSTRSMSLNATSAAGSANPQIKSAPTIPPPRQIRFVSTDGQPHTKRRRINAACLTCRKRKTRCSGERPECKTCTDNNHVCAGYIEKAPSKEDEGHEEQYGEDEEEPTSSPPRKVKQELPKVTHQAAGDLDTPPDPLNKDENEFLASPGSILTSNSVTSNRNRVPYFRYFGPTAIAPGFKQMVVQLKDHRRSLPLFPWESPISGTNHDGGSLNGADRTPIEIPFYDAVDPSPNAPLITHLCETFFNHLGCNYPFLQRERFLKDLEEKRVDAILVDAVCAVAARFSPSPLLIKSADPSVPLDSDNSVRRAFRGNAFAQRAMSAVIDTFPCPTIAVAQACLLLAYEEFGTDHDSGLWMYLGTSIRMAQDLGIQKLDGLHLEGRIGPTPKTAKQGEEGKAEETKRALQQRVLSKQLADKEPKLLENRRASESERIDTFWAIFFLDRTVSTGVGRPVTLRDKDIEISFPYRPDETMVNGHPHPFPPLIRIIHMYGRVSDVLNSIKDVSQVTPDVLKRLASMERDLTGIYQRLSPKLHFNATNFQHYVKAGQGTNFILLHFWFHTLIVLLHQPTLLHSFEGRIQQLFSDSRELSMSSAKTIADILAFAELIDVKSFIGNPFTSQPMYVAACAFLAEAAAHASQPPSRGSTPPKHGSGQKKLKDRTLEKTPSEQKAVSAKHTLLASAANQNYQRCYKALQVLNSYWAGCRYIITALDQKAKGLMDPLLFTSDDIDGEMPSTELSFTTPGWRRSGASPPSGSAMSALRNMRSSAGPTTAIAASPKMEWSQAIGWSLSGTTNSPAPNLSLLYPSNSGDGENKNVSRTNIKRSRITGPDQSSQQNISASSYPNTGFRPLEQTYNYLNSPTMMPPPQRRQTTLPYDPVSTAEADLLLGLHSPFPSNSTPPQLLPPLPTAQIPDTSAPNFVYTIPQPLPPSQSTGNPGAQASFINPAQMDFSDMLIESQDIDMSGQNGVFAFPGGDMIPWLEYLPQDVLNYFGDTVMDAGMGIDPSSTADQGQSEGGN